MNAASRCLVCEDAGGRGGMAACRGGMAAGRGGGAAAATASRGTAGLLGMAGFTKSWAATNGVFTEGFSSRRRAGSLEGTPVPKLGLGMLIGRGILIGRRSRPGGGAALGLGSTWPSSLATEPEEAALEGMP